VSTAAPALDLRAHSGRRLKLQARADGLLTWKRAAAYSAFVGLVYLLAWAYFSLAGTAPLNRVGEPLGGDYIAFFTAGRMLLDGQSSQIYDPSAVRAAQAQTRCATRLSSHSCSSHLRSSTWCRASRRGRL
jgi:hypothetical protein